MYFQWHERQEKEEIVLLHSSSESGSTLGGHGMGGPAVPPSRVLLRLFVSYMGWDLGPCLTCVGYMNPVEPPNAHLWSIICFY